MTGPAAAPPGVPQPLSGVGNYPRVALVGAYAMHYCSRSSRGLSGRFRPFSADLRASRPVSMPEICL